MPQYYKTCPKCGQRSIEYFYDPEGYTEDAYFECFKCGARLSVEGLYDAYAEGGEDENGTGED